MTSLLILLLALVLLLLRQSLFVVLGMVTASAYFVMGEAGFVNLVLDSWGALNREVLLAIPPIFWREISWRVGRWLPDWLL